MCVCLSVCKSGHVCVSVCLSGCVCSSVCLSVCKSGYVCVSAVCLSVSLVRRYDEMADKLNGHPEDTEALVKLQYFLNTVSLSFYLISSFMFIFKHYTVSK